MRDSIVFSKLQALSGLWFSVAWFIITGRGEVKGSCTTQRSGRILEWGHTFLSVHFGATLDKIPFPEMSH